MKIQCDVCMLVCASVFCCADEAALCDNCDHGVHKANKLASKHKRFSLINNSSSTHSSPLCDVCQEKRGLIFCREDRAVFCRDCDAEIHSANELTMKHSRFILTGLRLSSAPLVQPLHEERESMKHNSNNTSIVTMTSNSNSSSISDYLIKMLPGWHVEEFLNDDAVAGDTNYSYSKQTEEVSSFFSTTMDESKCIREGVLMLKGEHERASKEMKVKKKQVNNGQSWDYFGAQKSAKVSVRYM